MAAACPRLACRSLAPGIGLQFGVDAYESELADRLAKTVMDAVAEYLSSNGMPHSISQYLASSYTESRVESLERMVRDLQNQRRY